MGLTRGPRARMEDMETTGTKLVREKAVNPAVLSNSGRIASISARVGPEALVEPAQHVVGYGLPCANCRAYYAADMPACPICKSKQRVSITDSIPATAEPAAAELDHAKLLTEERERLRELKSQIYASHSQVPPAAFRCALDQNHSATVEPAAVCHSCYGEARQMADRFEAALHMDPHEAAKIVYDAVWSDPSDPNKTYLNAAVALLTELRKRAGIGLLLGSNQPLAH
jgi:hypothetical protein